MGSNHEWIPLLDYAVKTGVSLSTLRRYIKAGKVQYKVENGRYLLFNENEQKSDLNPELQKAQEEIAELKTLISFYEEKFLTERTL